MTTKVVYIIYRYIDPFECERFGIDIWKNRGISAEVWVLSKLFEGVKKRECSVIDERVIVLEGWGNFIKELIKQKRNTIFFMMLPPNHRELYYIGAMIRSLGYKYCMTYPQPLLLKFNYTGNLASEFPKQNRDIVNAVLDCIFPPSYTFIAAPASYWEFPSVRAIRRKSNIMIHTLDYDRYMKVREERERFIQNKYILFIDEYFIGHPNYSVLKVKCPFKREDDYFGPLRDLFDKVENMYGIEVVIAEHPRADYKDKSVFGNRKSYKGETERLIRDAEIVLCHPTMAMSFIMLFKKEFILIYLEGIKYFHEWAKVYIPLVKYFNICALNISEGYEEQDIRKCICRKDNKKRKKYIQQYVKRFGTEEKPFWEVVADKLV